MKTYILYFILESDATFGRGDGVAGVVDVEVQHDEWGCPYLGGRSLKGLLVGECAEILAALPGNVRGRWEKAAQRLFGNPGSGLQDNALLSVGDALLPSDLRAAIVQDIAREKVRPEEVLGSITALRHQTAMGETGVPLEHTLRTIRVILRRTPFEAQLSFLEDPTEDYFALLAACVNAFRRAGTGRNRGRGRLKAELLDASRQSITKEHFTVFKNEVIGS